MRGVLVGKAYNLGGLKQSHYYTNWVKGGEVIEEASKIGGFWENFWIGRVYFQAA